MLHWIIGFSTVRRHLKNAHLSTKRTNVKKILTDGRCADL